MSPPPAIDCLVLDVDGVLTDGRLYYGDAAEPLRAFDIQDGLAIRWFQRLGGTVVVLTGKSSRAVARRSEELGIQHVIQASESKLSDLRPMLSRLSISLDRTAMIGDDLPDLPVLAACGYPIAVANAAEPVRRAARFVTSRKGGRGAVREAVEHLLGDRWSQVIEHYQDQPALAASRQGNRNA